MPRRPRFRRPRYRQWAIFLVVSLVSLARVWWLSTEGTPAPLVEGVYHVRHVIDGDTLVLDSGHRIRLQGVDTPELARDQQPAEPFARAATEYTQAFVDGAGGILRVEFTDERLDRYGRTLAFLWSKELCLNEELVREGLAQARLDYRFSGVMRPRLRDAQQHAQATRIGIWSTN